MDTVRTRCPAAPGPAATALLEAAETLFVEKGIDGTSSREIARRAGQKNHSAVNYNFGSLEGLVDALIEHRVAPVNRLREQQLAALLEREPLPPLPDLVGLMLRPMAAQLLAPGGRTHYLNLLSQLLSRSHWRELFMHNRSRSTVLVTIAGLAEQHLRDTLPRAIYEERLRLLGTHIVHSVAEWHTEMLTGDLPRDPAALDWRVDNLISYSVAGLTAPPPPGLESTSSASTSSASISSESTP